MTTTSTRFSIDDPGGDALERRWPTTEEYIAMVVAEGERFACVAESGELDVAIRACPGWDLRDLVRHVGEIHLWAAANVAHPTSTWLLVRQLSDLARYWPGLATQWPPDDELVSWYRATHANLVDVLRSAPVDVEAFTFLPAPSPLTMWARRQASEIAIHRVDVEQACGIDSQIDPGFASDMLDELVSGFAPLRRANGLGQRRVVRVVAVDVEEQWWVTIGSAGVTTSRTGQDADLTIRGTAEQLYLSVWNRTPDATVDLDGDLDVMDVWRAICSVEWFR